MNKIVAAGAALALAAGIAGASWWAYEAGHLGSNPRAPTLQNFKPVIDAWAMSKGELRPKCLSTSPDSAPGSRRGRPGWSSGDAMGLGVTTLSLKTPSPAQQLMRDKTLLRFDLLAREGFFDATETTMTLDTGETLLAREYVLTQKGWENSSTGCVYLGRPEVLEVLSFARVEPDPDGVRAYELSYKVGLRALPPWANTDEAREILGDLKPFQVQEEKRLRLLRSEHGWLPEPLVKTKEGGIDRSRLARRFDDLLPAISAAQIVTLSKEHDFLRAPSVCLALPSQIGRDADEIEWSLNGPVSFTLYEADVVTHPLPRIRESWSARLDGLARGGVFAIQTIARDPIRNHPPGIRYVLDQQYLPQIGKTGPGCLRIAPLKLDILPAGIELQGRQDGTPSYRFKGIGRIADDAWVRGVNAPGVPELDAYLNYGVPISGLVDFKDGQWRIVQAGAATPVIVEPPVPRLPDYSFAPGAPAAAMGVAAASAGATVRPAVAGSVHVISVYQARRTAATAEEGTISVGVGAKPGPITLVLSAYEPVHWQILPDRGAEIARVVVMGNTPGRVSGVAHDRVQRVNGYLRAYRAGSSDERVRYDPAVTAAAVERLVGRRPDSVDGTYEAHYFSLGSSRPPPAAPSLSPPPASPRGAISAYPVAAAPPRPAGAMVTMPQRREPVMVPHLELPTGR